MICVISLNTNIGLGVHLTLIVLGCDAKSSKKCPCSHNNNNALIKLKSLFDTAFKVKASTESYRKTFDQLGGQNRDKASPALPPQYY